MKTIVFIGTQKSGSSREAIKAAQELGYFTILLTDNEKQIAQREEYPDVHLMIKCDLNDIKALKNTIEEIRINAFEIKAIVSFVDSHVHTACLLSDIFGVKSFTTKAVYNMENKLLSRRCLENTNYIPKYMVIDPNKTYTELEIENFLPGVLKSPNSTGSKDVYKINNYEEFIKQVKNIRNKYPDKSILLEEYLAGPQYLVEVLVIKSEIIIMAIVEQEISYINDHFIVTGYYLVIDHQDSFFQQLKKAVLEIVYLHGLRNGSCHLEMRYVNDNWKLIEINPRISGGGMNQLIDAAYGVNLVKETLKILLNKFPDIKPKYKRHAYIQYATVSKEGYVLKITGKKRALKKKGVLKVYVKPRKGNYVYLPKSMGNRYAYVLAVGKSKEDAMFIAKNALNEIQFVISENKNSG